MAKAKAAGAPAWMATFADLMSLLMCFFVLLLSFAEMDIEKFKQIAGEMSVAFGVQRVVKAEHAPSDDSAVLGELSSGGLSATPTDEAHRMTTSEKQLDMADRPEPKPFDTENLEAAKKAVQAEKEKKAIEELKRLKEALQRDITEGRVDVEGDQNAVTIRIQEKGAFPSGSADVVRAFRPLLERISKVLETTDGHIAIAGHTDDRPIKTRRYRSNWELSTARAVTVVQNVLAMSDLDETRLEVRGYGASRPLVPNDTKENRRQNRRVEIIVSHAKEEKPLQLPDEADGNDEATKAAVEKAAAKDKSADDQPKDKKAKS